MGSTTRSSASIRCPTRRTRTSTDRIGAVDSEARACTLRERSAAVAPIENGISAPVP